MNIVSQVSVRTSPLVNEDGPDVMDSNDEDSPKEEHGDVLSGMYTAGLKIPVLLSQSEVARERAAPSRVLLSQSEVEVNVLLLCCYAPSRVIRRC
jgi:hypothetical protein